MQAEPCVNAIAPIVSRKNHEHAATVTRDPGDIIESVFIKGDLAKLTAQERADYYTAVCRSVGLNPLTQPLAYITLNGKLTLYALKGATDQLRRIYKVSVESMDETCGRRPHRHLQGPQRRGSN